MATYVYDFATTGCGLRPPSKAALLKAQGEKASQQKIILRGIGTYQFYVGAKAAYIHAIMAPVLLMAVGVLLRRRRLQRYHNSMHAADFRGDVPGCAAALAGSPTGEAGDRRQRVKHRGFIAI